MFDPYFNNNFNNSNIQGGIQGNTNPYYSGNTDPYYYGENSQRLQQQQVPEGQNEAMLYPQEQQINNDFVNAYSEGGSVESDDYPSLADLMRQRRIQRLERENVNNASLPNIAEIIRMQGATHGDTILAHINPVEAALLKGIGGSGTINPATGLPQFFFRGVRNFVRNPGRTMHKAIKNPKRTLGDAIATLAAIYGGPIGGGIGGALRSVIRNEGENPLAGALRGAFHGSAVPAVTGAIGSGLSSIGASNIGGTLSNYAKSNMGSWMGNMGQVGGGITGLGNTLKSTLGINAISDSAATPAVQSGVSAGDNVFSGFDKAGGDESWFSKLLGNTKTFATKPKNILTMASAAGSFLNRPKEKSPEKLADEHKRMQRALMLNPQELEEKEAYEIAQEQARRRIARNKFLPEERLGDIRPVFAQYHSPEEYRQNGRWVSYYDNPHFQGQRINFKKGGGVTPKYFEEEIIEYPGQLGSYLQGETGGKDDMIDAKLSDGEYVVRADSVSDVGDGNNLAGARKLDQFFENISSHKRGGKTGPSPKTKSLASYMRG